MLHIEIPPFDVIKGAKIPFNGFGKIINKSRKIEIKFQKVTTDAYCRIKDIFEIDLIRQDLETASELENLISKMWSEGWTPEVGDYNLFSRDFGSLLANEIKFKLSGEYIFRSSERLDYMSIFWKEKKIEAFPFLKVLKRLFNKDGESITYFFASLKKELGVM